MSQMVPVNNFKWVEHISEFDEIFIKSYNEESDEKYFLEIDVQYHENLHQTESNLLFASSISICIKSKNFLLIYMENLNLS